MTWLRRSPDHRSGSAPRPGPEATAAPARRGYGRGAAILSAGIGLTGVITFAYFSLASHALSEDDYGGVALLWSAIFITVSVLYRPVEQLLSRTIADHDARGIPGNDALRVAATIQLGLGLLFAVLALAFRGRLENDLFDGSATLYWLLIAAVLFYAASYFARGYLAGHRRYELYGGLVLMESTSRFLFALAVTLGIAHGQAAVALGMAAAPLLSLVVVPAALARRLAPSVAAPVAEASAARAEAGPREPQFSLSHGTGFALAVLAIMLSEQTFLNAGPLLVRATEGDRGAALAGFVFNVLLLARAPLVLFQAVQTSILPHLTRLWVTGEGADPFRRSVNMTLLAIAGFAGGVALVMAAAGPSLMGVVFGGDFEYERGGLVLVSVAMGLYLSAATLNQALLAQGRARQACAVWVGSATGFVAFLLVSPIDDPVLSVEVALIGAAACLCALLNSLYRRA